MSPLLEAPLAEILRPTPTELDALGFAYDDVGAMPEDPTPEFPDGDDSIHGDPARPQPLSLAMAEPMIRAGNVATARKPFLVVLPRELRWKDHGRAVTAMQRGLKAGGWRKMRPTGDYYRPTVRQVEAFKRAKRLPVKNGKVFGYAAHKAMLPHYDAYDGWLMSHDHEAAAERMRWRVVTTAFTFLSAAPRVHYTQGPMRMQIVRTRDLPPLTTGDIWEDCSSLVTACYWIGTDGKLDPNDYGFDGRTGWTGTLSRNGRSVTLAGARPSDLVFYGSGPPWNHVAMYVGAGRVISHGSEPGPYHLPIDYRGDRGLILNFIR